MLNIATARGGWFHQFGGLSAPINVWANAYYRPGTVTCGFDMWIQERSYDEERDVFELTVSNYGERSGSILAVTRGMHAGKAEAFLNGAVLPVSQRTDGAVEISIPAGVRNGSIVLRG